jgi:hypothetical protein
MQSRRKDLTLAELHFGLSLTDMAQFPTSSGDPKKSAIASLSGMEDEDKNLSAAQTLFLLFTITDFIKRWWSGSLPSTAMNERVLDWAVATSHRSRD